MRKGTFLYHYSIASLLKRVISQGGIFQVVYGESSYSHKALKAGLQLLVHRDMLNEFGSMREGPIQRSTVTHKRGYDTSNTPPASTIPMVSFPSIPSFVPTSQVNFPFDQHKTQDPVVAQRSSNWDLSNSLLAQMTSYTSKSTHDALGNQSLAEADFDQSAPIVPTEESTLPNVDDKLLSLWLNAPTGFRYARMLSCLICCSSSISVSTNGMHILRV